MWLEGSVLEFETTLKIDPVFSSSGQSSGLKMNTFNSLVFSECTCFKLMPSKIVLLVMEVSGLLG